MEKKINKLLIPYCFFVLLVNIISFFRAHLLDEEFNYASPFYIAFTENWQNFFYSGAVWFLVCLFNMYMIYLIIDKICFNKESIRTIIVCILSFSSFLFGVYGIRIPFWIDSSLTGLVFLYLGDMMKRKTTIMENYKSTHTKIRDCILIIILFLFVLFNASGYKDFRSNSFECTAFSLYICGFAGVIMILLLSKLINHIKLISYIGRYSIIILGVHQLFIREIVLINWNVGPKLATLIDFVLVMTLSAICIPVFKSLFSKFVAQEDLFHFTR